MSDDLRERPSDARPNVIAPASEDLRARLDETVAALTQPPGPAPCTCNANAHKGGPWEWCANCRAALSEMGEPAPAPAGEPRDE
jgi:hypothetical protein